MNESGDKHNKRYDGKGVGIIAGALVLLATLAFVPADFDALNFFDPAKRLVWMVLAVFLAIVCWRRAQQPLSPVEGLALALVGWMILRSLLRPVPTAEMGVLFAWCLPAIMFALGLAVARGTEKDEACSPPGKLRIIGGLLVAAGLSQAVLMILQRIGLDPLFAATTAEMDYAPGRMVGVIGYQNQAVDFIALALCGLVLMRKSISSFLCGVTLIMPVLVMTGYRGGILAILVSATAVVVVLVWRRSKTGDGLSVFKSLAWLASVILVTAMSILFVPETGGRFRQLFAVVLDRLAPSDISESEPPDDDKDASERPAEPAINSRLYMARIGWQMFTERPVTGWGAGEYALQYLDRLGDMLPVEKDHAVLQSVVFAREAHNDPLQFAAEFGLIGLALLAGLVFTGCRRFSQANVSHWQVIAAVYVFYYMSVAALFSFPWQSAMAGPLAAFLLGLVWPAQEPGSEASTISRLALRGYNTTILIMAIGLLGWYGRDAFLNLAIPARLAADDADGAGRRLSRVDYRYHALIGASHAANGHYDSALRTLHHARLGYRDVLLWNNLGHVLTRKGEWREAQTVYEAWAASGLDHANALQNLSVASENTGEVQCATKHLSTRMRLWPESVSMHDIKRLAVLQLQAGNPRQAAMTLDHYQHRWMHGRPRSVAEMENVAGSIAKILGEREQAEAWFRAALERYPELESARRNLDEL